mgnify:CR=1 FL=1
MKTMPAIIQRNHLIRDAIGQALYDGMKLDSAIHLFGEGAHAKIHYDAPKIEAAFLDRVHTLPISEDGNTNFAVGASLLGIKPVVDVISADFLYRMMDSIANTAAKLNFMRPNEDPKTIVIRAEFLTGGPTTGQRPESLFTHIPGLRVVIPSTPRHAYGLMRTALSTPGVTLFFEDRMIQDNDEWSPSDLIPAGPLPIGAASWCHRGRRGNATIVTYGIMRQVVQRVLRRYTSTNDYPMLCDLIDLVSLAPIDWNFITKMLERTRYREGWLLIVEPDIQYGGIGAEIAAYYQKCRPRMQVRRLGAPFATIPASMALHAQMLPSEEDILGAIRSFH